MHFSTLDKYRPFFPCKTVFHASEARDVPVKIDLVRKYRCKEKGCARSHRHLQAPAADPLRCVEGVHGRVEWVKEVISV